MKRTLSRVNHHVEDFKRSFRIEGSFTQNLAITFSGNVTAQLIGFIFTPFIARIYGPESYGVFALFIAIVNNLSPLSTLQFPTGFVTAVSAEEFYRLVKITLVVILATTAFYCFVLYWSQDELVSFFGITELKPFIYWMPIYFLLIGIDQVLSGWNIRLKEFKRGAAAKMFSSTISKGSAILLGVLMQPSALGMIIGNLVSYPFESLVKSGPVIRSQVVHIFKPVSWDEIKSTLKKFKGYALYVTPGLFVSNFSSQLPVFYFSLAYSHETVGLFALANSMVNMPLALVINSSTTVFLQKAAETMQQSDKELTELVKSLYKKLFLTSFIPLALLALISEWIFKVVFGAAWEQSGMFASVLCLSAVFHVANSPLTVLFRLLHQEKVNFLLNILFTIIKFLGLWIGVFYNSIMISVICYSVASLLSSLLSLFNVFRMVRLSPMILLRDILLVFFILLVVIALKI